MAHPPALPPRKNSLASSISTVSSYASYVEPDPYQPQVRTNTVHLTPYTQYKASKEAHPYGGATGLDDPRTSSTQSLSPEDAGNRRTLLVVYIHGFMGTETSFKSFPAHVHNLLKMSMADTHVVHTKVYPRYQSRKNISYARDAFSNWLTPHEGDDVDVILIGHSLGGILAAEVVLLPTHRPGSKDLFQHRIVGHIAYDTPFLGMHPGVVSTGIASLFKSNPEPPEAPAQDQSAQADQTAPLSFNPFEEKTNDPNFNPAFTNDVNLPIRSGTINKAFYFLNKHYGDWRQATATYLKSHLEFGGCMADYDGLKKRYAAFRPLEDVDELTTKKTAGGRVIPRVRFVNYYTASTGRIKPKPEQSEEGQKVLVAETEMVEKPSHGRSRSITPSFSLSEHGDGEVINKDLEEMRDTESMKIGEIESHSEMQQLEPEAEPPSPPVGEVDEYRKPVFTERLDTESILTAELDGTTLNSSANSLQSTLSSLPPLTEPPIAPAPFDPTTYNGDSATLNLARKEHERTMKAYERSKKDYDKTVKEREKYIQKLEKAKRKQEEKDAKLSPHERSERERLRKEEERMQKEKERMEGKSQHSDVKRASTLNQEQHDAALARQKAEEEDRLAFEADQAELKKAKKAKKAKKEAKPPKKQRDRKFCTLPKKDPKTGIRDESWIRVFFQGIDEVTAHTSLFFVSETYAKLVGDTAERIEQWVRDAATMKAVREAQEWEQGGR